MRIIQLVDSFGSSGGLERFVYNLSGALLNRGHETVIVTAEPSADHNWGTKSFDEICLRRDSDSWTDSIRELRPDLIMWHCLPQMVPVILNICDAFPIIATVHGATCPSGTRLLTDNDQICFRKGGVACLTNWYVHRCGFGKSPISAVKAIHNHTSMIKALRSCLRVYSVSEAIANFLVIEGIPQDNIRVFDNTLGAISDLQRLRTRTQSIDTNRPVRLLYVGRLVYPKGVQYLINALNELIQSGQSFTCEIVGDGWYEKSLRTLVENLGISEHVTFSGRVPGYQVEDKYRSADIVVVPSIWPDPAPLVVPEARQLGKPVVVFDSGGLPEWASLLGGVHVANRADAHGLALRISEVAETYSVAMEFNEPEIEENHTLTRLDLLSEIETSVITISF